MTPKPPPPEAADDKQRPQEPAPEEPGSNAVEHQPDPQAEPVPDGEPKFVPRSPYRSGND